jgi:crossover junction endodeoxyribonuclease RusA
VTMSTGFSVRIEAPGKQFLTANGRGVWMKWHKLTATWRLNAAWAARMAGIPRQGERVRVVAELRFTSKRRRDVANWYPTVKACIDGLVDAHVLVDDSDTYVQGPDMRVGPSDSNGCVVLHLMPIEPDRNDVAEAA